jgi:hypothetical protein
MLSKFRQHEVRQLPLHMKVLVAMHCLLNLVQLQQLPELHDLPHIRDVQGVLVPLVQPYKHQLMQMA